MSYSHLINNFHVLCQVLESNSANYTGSYNYFYLLIVICLHSVIQFQVSNKYNIFWDINGSPNPVEKIRPSVT